MIGLTVFLALIGSYLLQVRYRRTPMEALNFSCFIYRDINRNGLYDMGDRPYAGLKVSLRRPDGSRAEAESNLAGFANFPMSTISKRTPIHGEGLHEVDVTAPGGWLITSRNSKQSVRFRAFPGSPVALVGDRTFEPVGIAADLVIKGHFPTATSLEVEDPQGKSRPVPRAVDGRFEIPASAGNWRLSVGDQSGAAFVRVVTVENYPVFVSGSGLAERGNPAMRKQQSVNFDELTTSDTLIEIPRGYGGLEWINWVATHHKFYQAAGLINATTSGEFVAYNSSGHPAVIEGKGKDRFDLIGMTMSQAWHGGESHDVVVRAWRGDRIVHEDRFRTRVAGPLYFSADYRDISRVEIASAAYWQVVVDDVKFATDN